MSFSIQQQQPVKKLDIQQQERKQFQEFEQNVYLPLNTNPDFQTFKKNLKDTNFRTKYLTWGIFFKDFV